MLAGRKRRERCVMGTNVGWEMVLKGRRGCECGGGGGGERDVVYGGGGCRYDAGDPNVDNGIKSQQCHYNPSFCNSL
jgi:hypothetical protein